ncbi:MAG: leucine-rich repeat domain-containing protein [Candidatus Margulisiibacteriota bacterium]
MTRIASQVRARKFQLSVGLSIAAHLVAVKTGSSITPRTVSLGQENQTVCFAVPDLLPKGVADSNQVCHSIVNAAEAQDDLDHPTIKENHISPEEAVVYRRGLDEYLAKGKGALEQYAREGKSDLDFGEFFISFEYYAQHLDPAAYLMPKDSREELLMMYQQDVETFAPIARDESLTREEKFLRLVAMVESKSVPDPGANIITSLLVPEGGQECHTRSLYELAIAYHFSGELLEPGEKFIVGKYAGRHHDLGIYNEKKQTVFWVKMNMIEGRWRASLYDPHIEVRLHVEEVEKHASDNDQSAQSYNQYLVAQANERNDAPIGDPGKFTGPKSPLDFFDDLPGVRSKFSFRGYEVIAKRESAGDQLREKRLARARIEAALLPDSTMKAIRAVDELSQINDLAPDELGMTLNPDTNKISVSIMHSNRLKDISQLAGVTEEIEELNLLGTSVSDLRPLAGLTGLQNLVLDNTQVRDLWPLSGLTGLQKLYLNNTQVSDLRPLAGLTGLQVLDLSNLQVSDLRPLAGLTGMQYLYLLNTQVSDLRPLAGLTGLQDLDLRNTKTQVSDLQSLVGLTGLKLIGLNDMGVYDLLPLTGLTAFPYNGRFARK